MWYVPHYSYNHNDKDFHNTVGICFPFNQIKQNAKAKNKETHINRGTYIEKAI